MESNQARPLSQVVDPNMADLVSSPCSGWTLDPDHFTTHALVGDLTLIFDHALVDDLALII